MEWIDYINTTLHTKKKKTGLGGSWVDVYMKTPEGSVQECGWTINFH